MEFNEVFDKLRGVYTTNELNMQIHRYFRGQRNYPLTESGEGTLHWLGEKLVPLIRPVYLPPKELAARQPVRNGVSRHSSFWRITGKRVYLRERCFIRCTFTEGRWILLDADSGFFLRFPGDTMETLVLREDGAVYEHYVATEEENCGEPAPRFTWYEAGGEITITGVESYTENLTIPAVLDGKKVAAAYIASSQLIWNLRSLTVEPGVRKLDFPWELEVLKQISLPKSLILLNQPLGLRRSAWYADQPEGPVYLQNWYVGTKGTPFSRMLALREGTVGIAAEADSVSWSRILLPESLCYIGRDAFPAADIPPKVIYPAGGEQLAGAFEPFSRIFGTEGKEGTSRNCRVYPAVTGEDLYNLGRFHKELRPDIGSRWLPLVPKFFYIQGKWMAAFFYCTEEADRIGYYAAIDVANGQILMQKRLEPYTQILPGGVWTDRYQTPFYKVGEDYLDFCAAQIRSGISPEPEVLMEMGRWWALILPESIRKLTQQHFGASKEAMRRE